MTASATRLFGIGPAVLVDPFLQLVYGNSSHDVKGVRHIKIVRGKKPRHPMLDYHIGDFVLLGCKILQALFRKLEVVATRPGSDPESKIPTVASMASALGSHPEIKSDAKKRNHN